MNLAPTSGHTSHTTRIRELAQHLSSGNSHCCHITPIKHCSSLYFKPSELRELILTRKISLSFESCRIFPLLATLERARAPSHTWAAVKMFQAATVSAPLIGQMSDLLASDWSRHPLLFPTVRVYTDIYIGITSSGGRWSRIPCQKFQNKTRKLCLNLSKIQHLCFNMRTYLAVWSSSRIIITTWFIVQ